MPNTGSPPALVSRSTLLLLAVLLAVGVAGQAVSPTVADVSWLIELAEKSLAGQRLYVDIVETNPPMSVFLYMPAVLIEHLTGIRAEWNQIAITFAAIATSLWISALIMRRTGRADMVERFLVAGMLALAILPTMVFAQREHLAVIALLPSLAVLVARAERRSVDLPLALVAGLAAGLAATIKPHFAVAVIGPAVAVAIRLRSARSLFAIEHLVAVAVVAGYAALVVVAFPRYFSDVLPVVNDTYRLARRPLFELALHPQMLMVVGIGVSTLLLAGEERRSPRIVVPFLASLGFLFAFFEQGKGWHYHLFPAAAVAFMLFYAEAMPRLQTVLAGPGGGRLAGLAAGGLGLAGLIASMSYFTFANRTTLPLVAAIERLGPHPKVLAVSFYLSIGHPLTRAVGGTWVGTYCSQWISDAALFRSLQPETDAATRARMAEWIAKDHATIARDIRIGQPDVILADRLGYDWDETVKTTPGMAELMAGYAKTADVDGVDLLVRRDLLHGPATPVAAAGEAP
ncbi:MAG: hypothetical protein P4L82_16825 [Ancalomicrobiaceae bacterium]|nr:hypothetical protein [Ancalomicrobiaceae bacterium]